MADLSMLNTKFISTKTHGMIDYSTAVTLMAAPHLLGFADGGAETWVPTIMGGTTIVQSLMTDYELGVMPVIPMSLHLTLDIGNGAFLALSPFLFGTYKKGIMSWLPHVLIGLSEIVIALTTKQTPDMEDSIGDDLMEDKGDSISSFRIRSMNGSTVS